MIDKEYFGIHLNDFCDVWILFPSVNIYIRHIEKYKHFGIDINFLRWRLFVRIGKD